MLTVLRTSAVSALGFLPMSPFISPLVNWSTSVGVNNIPSESTTNNTLGLSSTSTES